MLALTAVVAAVVGFALGYFIARARRPAEPGANVAPPAMAPTPAPLANLSPTPVAPVAVANAPIATPTVVDSYADERARIIRSYEAEAASLRAALLTRDAEIAQSREFAADRSRLFADLAQARADTARYRQLVVDLENNAPPILFGPGTPDDLKLIVGVGPVLERMLHQLGVTLYRQIARWTDRDIDEFDARLPEFPGRIRRDEWVTQARALHQAKYGEALPPRGA